MTDEPHNTDEPRNEEEFLIRESRLAREALSQMRIEALESLGRTADVSAWAERYPWQSLGTAAVAGVGAGWTLGRTFRRRSSAASTVSSAQEFVDNASAPQNARRLPLGLWIGHTNRRCRLRRFRGARGIAYRSREIDCSRRYES